MLSCDEYIVEIDENGKINKIPYSPLLDVMGEENYKKYIKKLEENKLNKEIENNKNKFLNFDHHWVEVEKEEEADHYLIIHKENPNTYDLKELKKKEIVAERKEPEFKKEELEEMFNMKVYYLKYDRQDLRKKNKKKR